MKPKYDPEIHGDPPPLTAEFMAGMKPSLRGRPKLDARKGSIFDDADLNFPPDHRIKAELVDEISRRMATYGLTPAEAAARMGIAEPDLSNILNGKFRGFTVDRLTGMLARLG
jgi:predicted XRE-type DNA-binding protein